VLTALSQQAQYANQRLFQIEKELKAINGKLTFFVVVLILAIVFQFIASLFVIG
jgi:hypothetical protein